MNKSTYEKLAALLNNDDGNEIICEMITKAVEAVGAKNVVTGIPDDWEVSDNICNIDTLKGFAWAYLWNQLTEAQANDTGWDAGTENKDHYVVTFKEA